MSRIIGYLRAEVHEENILAQREQLKAAGVIQIFQEQPADAKRDRSQLDRLMADVRDGDSVVVTSLDRIAHSTRHLLEIVETLTAAGASLKVIDNDIDTSTSEGLVFRRLLGAINDFEGQVVRQRQAEGIARAKREGRYRGRKPTARAKTDEVLALNAQGLTRQKIADQLGIGVASVYRILKRHKAAEKTRQMIQKKPVAKPKRAERQRKPEPDTGQLSLFPKGAGTLP